MANSEKAKLTKTEKEGGRSQNAANQLPVKNEILTLQVQNNIFHTDKLAINKR